MVLEPATTRPDGDRLVDLREGSGVTGYAPETLRKYAHRPGGPPFVRRGRRYTAWLSELEAWADARRAEEAAS